MYDPARDTFTSAEETPDEKNQSEDNHKQQTPENHNAQNSSPRAHVKPEDFKESPRKFSRKIEVISQDDTSDQPPQKRARNGATDPAKAENDSPIPMTLANLPRISRRKPGQEALRAPRRSRSRSPGRKSRAEREGRDRPFTNRRRTPPVITKPRSPSPPPRSPPRKLKRPGGASRIPEAEKEHIRQRQLEKEAALLKSTQAEALSRGVHDAVRQHYNAVPQRGREWRKTESQIKGLRSFNNWIKSTIIQKFSPNEDFTPGATTGSSARWASGMEGDERGGQEKPGLRVLDLGCGKGGDLGKWQLAPQNVEVYIGLDPAEVSIEQARERFRQMNGEGRSGRPPNRGNNGGRKLFHAEFYVKDCFNEWIGDIPIIKEIGIDGRVGPGNGGGAISSRWGGGGFDVVSMMFCMHYAFESEHKARGMLRNVAGSLKKGGRLLGVIPNSDVLGSRVEEFHQKQKAAEASREPGSNDEAKEEGELEEFAEWGNTIYRVRFPGKTPLDGTFRPPFGWKYNFFLQEAVEEVPEYVVPWEAFRAIAEDYNLELQYRRPFADIWKEERDDPDLGPLSMRMGVKSRENGKLLVSDEEMEAANFYHAFCFYKV